VAADEAVKEAQHRYWPCRLDDGLVDGLFGLFWLIDSRCAFLGCSTDVL
jgi:hypothetical protein